MLDLRQFFFNSKGKYTRKVCVIQENKIYDSIKNQLGVTETNPSAIPELCVLVATPIEYRVSLHTMCPSH